jgi:hypothetical protein
MSILNTHDWDALAKKYQQAKPFPSICIDNFLEASFLQELMDAYPDYSDAVEQGREFKGTNEYRKVQITTPSDFPEPVSKLSALLASEEFLKNMEKLTGIDDLVWDPSFTGGGMHLTNSMGLLDVHVDFNFERKLDLYRRVNILIYLNKEWKTIWGGNVELWNEDVSKCIESFEPIANRCVIFSTNDISFHGVKAVTTPEGISRNSFAAYYYSKDAGDNAGEMYGGNHSTIFRARPQELKKKYFLMPMDALKKNVRKLKSRIRG